MMSRAKRISSWVWRHRLAAAGALLAPWLALAIAAVLTPLAPELESRRMSAPSTRLTDRNGVLLREVRADDGCRSRFVGLHEIGEHAQRAMIAAEDKRFFWHPGVDPLAIARAMGQAVLNRRVVSGASTLTQQLARTVVPRPRTLLGKIGEMVMAVRIEMSLSKREILEQYMNRAPFGPGLRGIEAASRYYFGKSARDLSLGEAVLLAGMPRRPSAYDPSKRTGPAERRRHRVLERMVAMGTVTREKADLAAAEPIAILKAGSGAGAPHFVRAVMSGAIDQRSGRLDRPSEVVTTLDAQLQREAEILARSTVSTLSLRHVTSAAVVVLDNRTGEILAYVGSPDISDAAALGENDGVRAKRQPGSTLKPFVYGLAMEKIAFTAATVLPDVDLHIVEDGADYHPQNYDGHFHGPVRLREALANSYNVPAVWTASRLGPPEVLGRLRALGFSSLDKDASYYGPAIALGDGEVTLLEITNAYAALARGGARLPVRAVRALRESGGAVRSIPVADATPTVDPAAAAVITDILGDRHARQASFGERSVLELPFPVAVKTGTSKGFRDNFAVGYTSDVTVGVWVGNFDGSPMQGVSGVAGAGPLFRDVMIAASRGHVLAGEPNRDLVRAEVCPLSGDLPGPSCPNRHLELFVPGTAPTATCSAHEAVRLDRRNGLRAGPSCPASVVEKRVFERFAPSLLGWAKTAGRPLVPDYSPLCPGRDPAAVGLRARITYPFDGATFAYDDEASSRPMLTLRAEAPAEATRVRFLVDDRVVGATRAPFAVAWRLERGTHRLRAEPDRGEGSETVELTVR
jgi:penicillin-binding protein 1C